MAEEKLKDTVGSIDAPITNGNYDSVLAALFRTILHENVISTKFMVLIDDYVMRYYRGVTNLKDKASVRANIRKEFMRPTMTWRTFLKGLKFLKVPKFTLTIDLHHRNGETSRHSILCNMEEFSPLEYLDDVAKETLPPD